MERSNICKMPTSLSIPISDPAVRELRVGEPVLLNGTLITARDTAHKWIHDRFITKKVVPDKQDLRDYDQLKALLDGGVIYHCGPVVGGLEVKDYHFVAAGPTTSLREEPYMADILQHFNLKGVIGKGGMGEKTLWALTKGSAAYFHAVGGAAALIARSVKKVVAVYQLDFGVPEAMWVIDVQDFPVVVTMDAHGESLHKRVRDCSENALRKLIDR